MSFEPLRCNMIDVIGYAPELAEFMSGSEIRFETGKTGRKDGWLKVFEDGVGAVYEDHRNPGIHTWQLRTKRTTEESSAFKKQVMQEKSTRKKRDLDKNKKAAEVAQSVWAKADPAQADHPYLLRKKCIPVNTLREIPQNDLVKIIGYEPKSNDSQLTGRILIVPVKVNNKLSTLEFIDESGLKSALAGGNKGGGIWSTCRLPKDDVALIIQIAEGVATAISCYSATGIPTLAVLSCGNFGKVAQYIRSKFPSTQLVILADQGNGQKSAEEAAKAVFGFLAVPKFKNPASSGTDFNDLLCEEGIESVSDQIRAAMSTKSEVKDFPDIWSEMEFARSFARRFFDQVCFDQDLGQFLVWTGNVWSHKSPGGAFPIVRSYIDQALDHAVKSPNRDVLVKTVLKYHNHGKQRSFLDAVSVTPEIIVKSDQFDRDTMLLNCSNGTVDLRTGQLRPHSPDDFITRILSIPYDQTAVCPVFMRFINSIMGGKLELIEYLHRLIGYFLTGSVDEQIFVIWIGVGSNGKSTLSNILLKLLGEYGGTAGGELLLKRKNQELPMKSTLASLRGKRLACVSELNEGEELLEAQVKMMTGEDRIEAKFYHRDPFSYNPQFKPLLLGNHRPVIRDTGIGIWRRIHLLPFDVIIPAAERDPQLLDKLTAELPGILAWAVRGCQEWQRKRLDPPEIVLTVTEEYRNDENIFLQWIDERCFLSSMTTSSSRTLLESFIDFSGNKRHSAKKLANQLKELGLISRKNSSGCMHWDGIGLQRTEDTEDRR